MRALFAAAAVAAAVAQTGPPEEQGGQEAVTADLAPEPGGISGAPRPTPAPPGAARAASPAAQELLRATLADDIAGADDAELRAEARRLGLDDAGSRQDLQTRLRRFYALPEAAPPAPPPEQTVAVRQAAHAEYRANAATGARSLVLRGGVELAVREAEDDTEHLIRADEVIYQQAEELLSARGGVEYRVSAAGGEPQEVSAASMAFDLASSKVVFVDGFTRHRRQGAAGPLVFSFAGDTITRLGDGTIILDRARVTSSPDPSLPNYELRAHRMWLLAPGEWALERATLFVGEVPVLYLPFFFLPGDELVFHPALGVRDREGLFLNTTLYLIGRRPPDEEPLSVLSLTDPGQYREEVRGLFLRKVAGEAPPDDHYLKLMLDLYARLGLFTGVAGVLPLAGDGAVEFQAAVARSRGIWELPGDGGYLASDPADPAGRSRWHDSSLFGVTVPLRYGAELAGRLAFPAGSLNGRLELFSDPGFLSDFGNREERFDWPSLIGFGSAGEEEEPARRSNLIWELDANADFAPLLAGGAAPALDQLHLQNVGVHWLWRSKKSVPPPAALPGDDPTREFFYPATLRLPLLAQLGGTLWQRPAAPQAAPEPAPAPDLPGGGLRPRTGAAETDPAPEEEESAPGGARRARLREPEALPQQPSLLPARRAGDGARLRYELRPGATVEGTHDHDDWNTAAEVDDALRHATVQLTNTALLEHHAELFGGVVGLDNSLRHHVVTQYLLHTADSLPDDERERLLDEALGQFASTVSLSNQVSLRPLLAAPAWEASAVTYDLGLRLLRLDYPKDPNDDLGRRLRTEWGGWDVDAVTSHRLQTLAEVQVADHPQRLTLSADLPPLPHDLSASLALNAARLTASASTGFRCRDDPEESTLLECGDWKPRPLELSAGVTPLEPLSLQQQFSIELDPAARVTRSVSSLGLGGFSAALILGRGADEPLSLRQLRLGYDETHGPAYLWRNRVRLELATRAGWTISFLQPRNNRFTFGTDLTAKVHEFLDLTFSVSSRNDRTYRYLPDWAREQGEDPLNPLQDLWESFAFWDEKLRRRSGFKLEQVSVSAVHHLQDWDLTVAYAARPQQKEGREELSSEFSIVVQWLPLPEIRSRLQADDESFSINE